MQKLLHNKKTEKNTLRRVLHAAAVFFLCFFIAALFSLLYNDTITVSSYETEGKPIAAPFRIALVSDLHHKKFDETNQYLVEIVKKQRPDIICIDGDMLEHAGQNTDEQLDALISLIERLYAIAPVYFAPGNHDYDVYGDFESIGTYFSYVAPSEYRKRLEESGAVFLENEYIDTEINGSSVRIGGFYSVAAAGNTDTYESCEKKALFLNDFCDTSAYKILLSHRPNAFIYGDGAKEHDIDLILCGHTHAGIVRLPFGIGAILTKDGLFPKYDKGIFDFFGTTMIINAGLDGHGLPPVVPRVFNPPEICSILVKPEE